MAGVARSIRIARSTGYVGHWICKKTNRGGSGRSGIDCCAVGRGRACINVLAPRVVTAQPESVALNCHQQRTDRKNACVATSFMVKPCAGAVLGRVRLQNTRTPVVRQGYVTKLAPGDGAHLANDRQRASSVRSARAGALAISQCARVTSDRCFLPPLETAAGFRW